MDENELSFIAVHLINLSVNDIPETMKSIQFVDDIVKIIEKEMNVQFQTDSYYYSRLITHLKYFSIRVLNHENMNTDYDESLESFVNEHYRLSMRCAKSIGEYIQEKYQYKIGKDEEIFLTLHLQQLLK